MSTYRTRELTPTNPDASWPGRHSPIGHRFTLLHIPSPGAAGPLELAYTESEGEVRYLDDKKALEAHESAWARLTNAALRFDETREFMQQVLREFKS